MVVRDSPEGLVLESVQELVFVHLASSISFYFIGRVPKFAFNLL